MLFTKPYLVRFERAYKKAVREGQEVFVVDGEEVLTAYAKYLIEYVKGVLKEKED